jgi:hypothetical protein
MGRVECVTFQEPESHVSEGGVIEGEDVVVGREEGARRVAMVCIEG